MLQQTGSETQWILHTQYKSPLSKHTALLLGLSVYNYNYRKIITTTVIFTFTSLDPHAQCSLIPIRSGISTFLGGNINVKKYLVNPSCGRTIINCKHIIITAMAPPLTKGRVVYQQGFI